MTYDVGGGGGISSAPPSTAGTSMKLRFDCVATRRLGGRGGVGGRRRWSCTRLDRSPTGNLRRNRVRRISFLVHDDEEYIISKIFLYCGGNVPLSKGKKKIDILPRSSKRRKC